MKVSTSTGMSWPSMGPTYSNPNPSNRMPGVSSTLVVSMARSTMRMAFCPGVSKASRKVRTRRRQRCMVPPAILRLSHSDMAPTVWLMDMALSLSTTIMSRRRAPALFSASKAMPPVRLASPMTAITLPGSSLRRMASSTPSAADSEVEAWPAPNTSWGLSLRDRKPEMPPSCLMVWNRPRRPQMILWAWAWWPMSQINLSEGESKA